MYFTLDEMLEFVVVGYGNRAATETLGVHIALLLETCKHCHAIIVHGVCHSVNANCVLVSKYAMAIDQDTMTQREMSIVI